MAIWIVCPECNGQKAFPSLDFLLGRLELPSPCWPLWDEYDTNFSNWIERNVFSGHFKRVSNLIQCNGVTVALACHNCLELGYVPASNFSFCAQGIAWKDSLKC